MQAGNMVVVTLRQKSIQKLCVVLVLVLSVSLLLAHYNADLLLSQSELMRSARNGRSLTDDLLEDLSCYSEDAHMKCVHPILTMFTTVMDDDPDRDIIHNNTFINWSALGSCVRTILYVNNTRIPMATLAESYNWQIQTVPHQLHNIPVLKSLYLKSFQISRTPLYLYANSDILFDVGLIKTVLTLLCTARHQSSSNAPIPPLDTSGRVGLDGGIFAVGRRYNVNQTDIYSPLPEHVADAARGKNLFETNAEDYFITTAGPAEMLSQPAISAMNHNPGYISKGSKFSSRRKRKGKRPLDADIKFNNTIKLFKGHFPWQYVPNFVIGRAGYDNWIVAQSVLWNVTWTLDFTSTVVAIHQTGGDGDRSGWSSVHHRNTVCINHLKAGLLYNYYPGRTTCMPWISTTNLNGAMTFVRREITDHMCNKTIENFVRNKYGC